jgi:hypothetical protein
MKKSGSGVMTNLQQKITRHYSRLTPCCGGAYFLFQGTNTSFLGAGPDRQLPIRLTLDLLPRAHGADQACGSSIGGSVEG